ncbi:MAG: pyridoxamine 5'-phosphate oxidase [Bacteroidia bacterium]
MKSLNEFTKNLRHDFLKASFDEKDADNNPFKQFEKWYEQAITTGFMSGIREPNACTLSTATKKGKPSSRIVLLRSFEKHGFVFFTNYDSRKGDELKENPYASLLFYWAELERQVRIEGKIVKASEAVSEAYFADRPRGSRIGAWASAQSKVLKNREVLESSIKTYTDKFKEEVPRPKHWGGYVLQATYYEFWQGRESRLHDRIAYTLKSKKWIKQRLAP